MSTTVTATYDSDPVCFASSAEDTFSAPAPTLIVERITTTSEDADTYLVTLTQPDSPDATLPALFIDVLDISGSMGSPASTNTATDAAAFSRADLVRHSVATQIELLRPQDSLAVVLFDHNSQIALPLTQDRATARSVLPRITANGGTNIWGGLFKALQIAEEKTVAASPQNVVILLQTDGESDPTYNPPRGIVPTLRAWLDTHPSVRLTIHTIGYGMGDGLDSFLLRAIADATGGTTNYIPDGSMVGTVFIHLMANLMSVVHKDLTLQIPEFGHTEHIGTLQSGQTRQLLVHAPPGTTAFSVSLRSIPAAVLTTADVLSVSAPSATAAAALAQTTLLKHLRDALTAAYVLPPMLPNPLTELTTLLRNLSALDTTGRVAAMLTDVADPDPSRGQISKAFASATAFARWGRHYIPTVISSLQNGWSINFKDRLSTEVFGTALTRELVARGDAIFMALPPPVSTSTTAYAAHYHSAPLSMATVHSSAGPCFLPGSRVRMADGSEKRCDQIQPGDQDAAGYTIQCVIKTLVPFADIVRLSGPHRPANAVPIPDDAGFTLWHPVINPATGEWSHPATMGTVERVATDAIYNFVLASPDDAAERPGMLTVNGLYTCTMGHNFRANAVIDHPYFGNRRPGHRHILDDLQQQPGWEYGYVTWSDLQVEHDPATGMICGMRPVPHA